MILSSIARHISLDPSESAYFLSLLNSKVFNKKDYILKAGQPCTAIYYVNSGALRAFFDHDGSESTIMFALADWWITDMPCFVSGAPAMISIEAIENSVVLELSKENLDQLFVKVPKFERLFRILMQNAYVREQLRVLQNLSLPAEERYQNFLKKYPAITQQVPQKHIASYLGITPEFLSTIRSKLAKGALS